MAILSSKIYQQQLAAGGPVSALLMLLRRLPEPKPIKKIIDDLYIYLKWKVHSIRLERMTEE